MDSLKFVKNFERLFAVQYMRQNARMWYSIGEPNATDTHSVEDLKKKDIVGVYRYKNTC